VSVQEPLQALLTELRQAIEASEAGSDNQAEIARLADEVDRRLNHDDEEGVVDDLRDAVDRFEVTHPRLAEAIGRAADALSALGL
jgi:hypothetical protein